MIYAGRILIRLGPRSFLVLLGEKVEGGGSSFESDSLAFMCRDGLAGAGGGGQERDWCGSETLSSPAGAAHSRVWT